MLGEIQYLSKNCWYIVGLKLDEFTKYVDWANAVVYRVADRLYLLETGFGEAIRQSLEKLIKEGMQLNY